MRIAICDDDPIICGYLEKIIINYANKAGYRLDVDVFSSGKDLINHMKDTTDLLFLDIELKDTTGVIIGNFLRKEQNNKKINIVFISAHPEYAMELFKIRPVDFLIKPFKESDIENIVDEHYKTYHSDEDFFQYKSGNDVGRIHYNDILYISSNLRKISIHRMNKGAIELYAKLDDICRKLPDKTFWRIHKSYVINVRHVELFQYDSITLDNGEVLSISKAYRQELRQKMLNEEEIL